ncbi:MAG TPA: hypothetical protein PK095_15565 [Myxococcota bacterium]|nr:hypothetical protein [Myxococcota bacterium]
MLQHVYWAPHDRRDHYLCELHGELRERARDGWLRQHECGGFVCEDCELESKVEEEGLNAHIELAQQNEAWVVVDQTERWSLRREHMSIGEAAKYLRGTWSGWMAPTKELAEAKRLELIAQSDGKREYSVCRAVDLLLKDLEVELIYLAREARIC